MTSSSMAVVPEPKKVRRYQPRRSNGCHSTFAKIGGLSHHINLLKEIIIMPLLHADLYKHFDIKSPRGVIFYGPPGTGKTLVAGTLAAEISKQSGRKVVFFHRKGADILDKWVGESERKLRELFEKARKSKPSLIFFDELDGLAPERSSRNDQVHTSVVSTLLALMDGLDDASGVVVIGATNRIECVDPALRRPGRFDRELYFPLPNSIGRQEILAVHTATWKHKPSSELLRQLAEATSGCCGSDLQALCAEAVLCCLKRIYPKISYQMNLNIDLDALQVTKDDFAKAHASIAPTMSRFGSCRLRKLTPFIRPLLQRQVDKVVSHIEILLPHFLDPNKKYTATGERYAGRMLLKGSCQQGLSNYIIPAIMQRFEHLQANVLDVPENYSRIINNAFHSAPSIIVLSRIDDWWDSLDNVSQMAIIGMLADLHSGLPILLVVSFDKQMPQALHAHFVNNTSILIEIDNPTNEERGAFFSPLFFGKACMSLWSVLHGEIVPDTKRETNENDVLSIANIQNPPTPESGSNRPLYSSQCICKRLLPDAHGCREWLRHRNGYNRYNSRRQRNVSVWLQSLKSSSIKPDLTSRVREQLKSNLSMFNNVEDIKEMRQSKSLEKQKVYNLWKRTTNLSTAGLPVVHLELLYDALLACITTNHNHFQETFKAFESTITSFEKI